MDTDKDLNGAIIDALMSSGIGEIMVEYSEQKFDAFVSADALRDLPFINMIVTMGKFGLRISDVVFTKKLVRFLAEIKDLNDEERESMIEKLNVEESFRQRVGERIIEILDRIDSHAKPEMVARAFKAFARLEIDHENLVALIYAIQIIPQHGLKLVMQFHKKASGGNHVILSKPDQSQFQIYNAFAIAGLAVMHPALGGALRYGPTSLCDTFVSIVLSEHIK